MEARCHLGLACESRSTRIGFLHQQHVKEFQFLLRLALFRSRGPLIVFKTAAALPVVFLLLHPLFRRLSGRPQGWALLTLGRVSFLVDVLPE